MRKYVLKSKNFEGELVFGFDSNELLILFENKAKLDEKHLAYLTSNFPFKLKDLTENLGSKVSTLTEVTDLTFERFWSEYNYKVGNKKRTEKLWSKLSDGVRITVLDSLVKYKYYIQTHKSLEKAYPETYLNQERYENEY